MAYAALVRMADIYSVATSVVATGTSTALAIIATAVDVIHSIACPTIRLRTDVVPGRLTIAESSYLLLSGRLHGQCSELCGALHGFMSFSIFYPVNPLLKDIFKNYILTNLRNFTILV